MTKLLLDNEFGLPYSEISEEDGGDAYCYGGEACLTKELGSKLVRLLPELIRQ